MGIFKSISAHIATKEEATHRYAICNACTHFNHTMKTCGLCGCFMVAKTKLRGSSCPDNRWQPIQFNPNDSHSVPEDDEYYKNV